jgi:hypothetical protein
MNETFIFSSCTHSTRIRNPGQYLLQIWGASRGNETYSGSGGYSKGVLTITEQTTIYIFLGGQGSCIQGVTQIPI